MKKCLFLILLFPSLTFALCDNWAITKEDKPKCNAMCSEYSDKDDLYYCQFVWWSPIELPPPPPLDAEEEKLMEESRRRCFVENNPQCIKVKIKGTDKSQVNKWKKKKDRFIKQLAKKEEKESKRKLKIESRCAHEAKDARTEFAATEIYHTCLKRNNYWNKD